MDLSNQRIEYAQSAIEIDTLDKCPVKQFSIWFDAANTAGILEPNAMVLSTVSSTNRPTQRTVLLKYFDQTGFVFFTNYNSRKATQIAENEHVSVLFPWYALQRQVEVNGIATKISAGESMKYFSRRPRGSQLGAWVSNQSSVVSKRSVLSAKLAELKSKFSAGEIPMPSFWGGYRIVPDRVEFWQGGGNRIHDRIQYRREEGDTWRRERLAP